MYHLIAGGLLSSLWLSLSIALGKKKVYGFARKPGKIENNGTTFLADLGDGSEIRGLGDPGYTMRKSKPRTSTSHQLCELAGSLVTDILLIQSLEVSREEATSFS